MTDELQQNCNKQSRIWTCLAGFEQMSETDTLIRRVGGSLIFERARLSFNLTRSRKPIRVENIKPDTWKKVRDFIAKWTPE